MPKTGIEIKEIVEECQRQGFEQLRSKARERRDQLYKHEGYRERLESGLSSQIKTRIAYMSDLPEHAAIQIQNIINPTLSFHVESSSDRLADKQELFYAHLWSVHFNKGNALRNSVHRHQVVSPFAALWLDYEPFILPDDPGEVEEYRRDYFPFHLSVLDPLSVSFLLDDDMNPSISTRAFDLSLIEIAKRFGDGTQIPGDDKSPLRIMQEQFDWLRAGKGIAKDSLQEVVSAKAKVYVVDDSTSIGYWTELDGVFHEVRKEVIQDDIRNEVENPWGRNSLFVVNGVYNDDADKAVDRYQGLLYSLMGGQYNFDAIMTHLSSLTFSPSQYGQVLPPEAAAASMLEDMVVPTPEAGHDNYIQNLLGRVEELKTQVNDNGFNLLQLAQAERDSLLPSPFLTNPDPSVTKDATATAQLAAIETADRMFDAARASEIKMIVDVCTAIRHFMTGGHEAFQGEKLRFRLAGSEKTTTTRGKSISDRKGEEIEISGTDFKNKDPLQVSIVAATDSQKMLRFQMKMEQVMAGAATKRDLIAETTEDVTGKEAELNEEQLFQQGNNAVLNGAFLMFQQIIMAETGEDLSFLSLGGQIPGADTGATPTDNSGPAPVNQNHMTSPAVGNPGIGATG